MKTDTFFSKFIALKSHMEIIKTLSYKLRLFGVPIDSPTDVSCNNQSVVNNTTNIESNLNNNLNSLDFHTVQWVVAANILRLGNFHTSENTADPYTKLISAYKREHHFGNWTY